jgi:hypothetical protein
MYSWSNFPTHHIFFPPRLEVVAFQQDPDGLSADMRNKFASNHLFGQQPHRPACPAFWRRRANNRDDALLLFEVQGRSLARSRGIEQRSLQAPLLIPLADLPYRLGGKHQVSAHRRRGLPMIHLMQRQRVLYRPNRLQTTAQHLLYLPPIFRG